MKKLKSRSQAGSRTSSVIKEIQRLVDELEYIDECLKSEGRSSPVDCAQALERAKCIKAIVAENQMRERQDADVLKILSFLVRLVEIIHSLLNCISSQKEPYEDWENYKAA
ncbi:MAG TPA: hypothetical protein VGK27_05520 [Candidatus Deferrimicrobiaceae bacterium]|jgi:hypothetical protein